MKTFIGYNINKPTEISNEIHTIINNQIRLKYIPKIGTLKIKGYVEAKNLTTMPVNGFYIDYKEKDGYLTCEGIVTFYTGHNGLSVTCDYSAVGTILDADTLNEIKAHMERVDALLNANDDQHSSFSSLIIGVRQEAANNLAMHNIDTNAHSDIRQQLFLDENLNTAAHSELRRNLTDHNNSQGAHADIRKQISDDEADFTQYKIDAAINQTEAISTHNFSTDCHSDIRLAIATNSETLTQLVYQLNSDTTESLSVETAQRKSADNLLQYNLNTESSIRLKVDTEIKDTIAITEQEIFDMFSVNVINTYKERQGT